MRTRSLKSFLPAASLLLLTALMAACASTPRVPADEIDLVGSYAFNGSVRGQNIDGRIIFPDDGGFILESAEGTCVNTTQRHEWQLEREASNGRLRLACGGLRLELDLVDGKIPDRATAYTFDVRYREFAISCAEYNEDGQCVREHMGERAETVTFEGEVAIRAL